MELVDGYAHCGLRKYRPLADVRHVLETAGVQRAVLVQHLGEYDNSYLGRIAAAEPQRFASVCLVDHRTKDPAATLHELAATGHFRGVRLTTDACYAAPQLLRAAVDNDLVIVFYAPDGIGVASQLLTDFLDDFPDARVVLTHLGTPDPAEGPMGLRSHPVLQFARYPQVHFQISGMKMYCPYPHTLLYPLIEAALAAYGSRRLCWGSNYPVVGDESDYVQDLSLLLDGKLPIPAAATPDICGGNARRLWFE